MKPKNVFLFIVAVMVGLGVLCIVLPHRLQVGTRTLKWPTLAEVFSEKTAVPDTTDILETPDSLDIPGPMPIRETRGTGAEARGPQGQT